MAKYKSPLNADTVSPLNAPPVQLGLQTKFNLLAIGLIVITALLISGFLVRQQLLDEQTRLKTQGMTIVSMLVELTDSAVATVDTAALREILDSLDADRDIAYVVVLDAQRKPLASRVFSVDVPTPIPPGSPTETKTDTAVRTVEGRRYLDLVAPIVTPNTTLPAAAAPSSRNAAGATGAPPIGYLQLGMSFDRSEA